MYYYDILHRSLSSQEFEVSRDRMLSSGLNVAPTISGSGDGMWRLGDLGL